MVASIEATLTSSNCEPATPQQVHMVWERPPPVTAVPKKRCSLLQLLEKRILQTQCFSKSEATQASEITKDLPVMTSTTPLNVPSGSNGAPLEPEVTFWQTMVSVNHELMSSKWYMSKGNCPHRGSPKLTRPPADEDTPYKVCGPDRTLLNILRQIVVRLTFKRKSMLPRGLCDAVPKPQPPGATSYLSPVTTPSGICKSLQKQMKSNARPAN